VGVEVFGMCGRTLEPVREAFAAVLEAQDGVGAGVAVWYDGGWVVDLWGGSTDAPGNPADPADPVGAADPAGPGGPGGQTPRQGRPRRPWEPDSIVQPYSVTKPFAAVCALLLVERGLLELDAPVQRYWPRFRARASVRQVLSHQAGVVALDEPAPSEVFYDWDAMCRLLADQEPSWPPGTAHGESALFYGHLVGELVRRVDGRTLGTFLREEVCGPRGLDFTVGLSAAERARAVDLVGLDDAFRRGTQEGRPALYAAAIANPPGAQDPAVVNGAAWRTAEVPAVNGHGTARAVAGLYSSLLTGGLLSASMLREAVTAQSSGADQVVGHDSAWGLGFGLDADGFGMGGLGGSIGWASTVGGYTFGFVTARAGTHDRADEVENALRDCLGLRPLDDGAPAPAVGALPAGLAG
jgi:CubicO group peptidase (beta-lactamase class C family)